MYGKIDLYYALGGIKMKLGAQFYSIRDNTTNPEDLKNAAAQAEGSFAQKLEESTGLPVKMWDERRTTVEAHNILSAHNYHGKKRKDTVDAVAASLILEGYLAFRGR